MAKDKTVEAAYEVEKLRRTAIRKEKRKEWRRYKRYKYGDSSDARCPYCDGTRSWCSGCQMWSSNCCEKYGTCQCS